MFSEILPSFNSMGTSFSSNSKEFDYSEIKKIYTEKVQGIPKHKKLIILLSTGSFNPIHRMHLTMYNIAYNFLSQKENYVVLCGLISPSSDCYVKHKAPPLLPFPKRCEMIDLAIEEQNYEFPIFLHKWEGSKSFFIDFPEVTEKIQRDVNQYVDKNIQVIYLCGMDHFIKCRYAFIKNVIAIDRKPYQNDKYECDEKHNIFCIKDDDNTKPYSSTEIKELIEKGDEESLNKIKKITYNSVANNYIKWYFSEYKTLGK